MPTPHSSDDPLPITSSDRSAAAASVAPVDPCAAERAARAYLLNAAEPPAPALARFVNEVGPVEAAERVRRADVPDDVEIVPRARRGVDRCKADMDLAATVGARLVIPEDAEWPGEALSPLGRADLEPLRSGIPLGLWVRGNRSLPAVMRRAVSIVGSRAATAYGSEVASQLAYEITHAGTTVISGAAHGIDSSAHRAALAADGTTVAVLANGVAVNYPSANKGLIDLIAETGLVLSEYCPAVLPARHRFLARNRLVACLGSGTVVVESGMRSGSHNTAITAQALGRVLMAVPGPITSAHSAGCHELVRFRGATLVTSAAEVLASCWPQPVDPSPSPAAGRSD